METTDIQSTFATIPTKEIARRLGVSLVFVHRMLEQGEIPAIRPCRRWVISRKRYEQWEATFGKSAVA